MMATALASDLPRSFLIGIGPDLNGMAARLGRHNGQLRFDREMSLGAGTAAARAKFAYQLDVAVREADRAVVLMGAGVACSAIAWWARLSPRQYTSRIAGALFFAPEDGDSAKKDAFASPRERLGFPSVIVDGLAARADPAYAAAFAQSCGSETMTYASPGELSAGELTALGWLGRTVRGWTASIVEHDVRLAASLAGKAGEH